ncbi:hypothetical protein [Bradyrhizobium prioriisuperbiae]|uniref:hypothetical protein n=1 Tax=Bradyrhizobium prioriisuperbiae TaxID=2854389 RepID=UPI0028E3CFA3|nr:hypothetical protein [Bradyrhizobium prioritasuperba]
MKVALLEALRQQPGDLGDATNSPKGRSVTARQKAALDSAFVGRLRHYPRGYATSKWGPFHSRQVVFSLVRAGLLKVSPTMRLATLTKRAREIYSDPTMN